MYHSPGQALFLESGGVLIDDHCSTEALFYSSSPLVHLLLTINLAFPLTKQSTSTPYSLTMASEVPSWSLEGKVALVTGSGMFT